MDILDRLASRCLTLCRIPSVTGEEKEICDHVVTWARAFLPEEEIIRHGNSLVLGKLPANPDRPVIMLAGHLDTVPPHEGDPPPTREQNRITGLGSSDMKSGVTVAMTLFEDLYEKELPYEIVLVLYEREEGPQIESGLRTLLAELPLLGNVDLAIVLEPTDEAIQIGCLGTIHATVSFQGKSAHSARPWQGRNAITAAGDFLSKLHSMKPRIVETAGQVFREVFTVTLARGGRYPNVVPNRFDLNLNYRFAPGKSLETAKQEILDLVDGRASVEFVDACPSGSVPWNNPLFRRLVDITGRDLAPKQAWTDVARLAEAGIDALNFGPGLTAQAHQAGEYCTIDSLTAAYRDLRLFLETAPAD